MRRKTPADFGPPTYKVGKGRPPAKSRWRPGQSGNPTGRPKGSKNLDTILTEILNGKIKYTTKSGKERTISVREAILKKIGQKALNGDLKSADYLLARDAEIARKKTGWGLKCQSLAVSFSGDPLNIFSPYQQRHKRVSPLYYCLQSSFTHDFDKRP